MNTLQEILKTKKIEIEQRQKEIGMSQLGNLPGINRKCISLKTNLLKHGSSGIIAEFKRKSPSKGEINFNVSIQEVTRGYIEAGAAGISVLTDYVYFGGSLDNLVKAREVNPGIPILRKDFIIDSYQVAEAKAYGADVVLLIAACLEKEQAEVLAKKAKGLGMEVLMEVHNSKELKMLNDYVDMVGVNNRNLKTFKTEVETSFKLASLIPHRYVKVSESGLSEVQKIRRLKEAGYRGFLIGEAFMATENPGQECKLLISALNEHTDKK